MKPELAKLIRKMWAHKLDGNSKFELYPIQAEIGAMLANEYSNDESVILIAAALYLASHMEGKGVDNYPHQALLNDYNKLYGDLNVTTEESSIESDDDGV